MKDHRSYALKFKKLLYCLSGGAAGAVSRITGTLGKGIAALTMDDKYQQERRQAMGKKPVNVKEGLTRGGKGLLEVRFVVTHIFARLYQLTDNAIGKSWHFKYRK